MILFNENDIKIIDDVIGFCDDNVYLDKLINLKEKIVSYCNLINCEEDFLDDNQKKILNIIRESILERTKVKIEYCSNGLKKQRLVYPKKIYKYDDFVMIVVQYSDDINDIRHLNLNRIEKVIN